VTCHKFIFSPSGPINPIEEIEMKHSLVTTLIAVATIVAPVAAEAGCTLYQHRDYGGSRWGLDDYERMIMIDGEPLGCTTNGHGDGCESTTYNSSWNDHVSSFKVTSGCTLTMWEHINQGGARFRSSRSYKYVGGDWNDKASEALCTCQ
jgi:syncollin